MSVHYLWRLWKHISKGKVDISLGYGLKKQELIEFRGNIPRLDRQYFGHSLEVHETSVQLPRVGPKLCQSPPSAIVG